MAAVLMIFHSDISLGLTMNVWV